MLIRFRIIPANAQSRKEPNWLKIISGGVFCHPVSFSLLLILWISGSLSAQTQRGAGLLMDDEQYEALPVAALSDDAGHRMAPSVSLKAYSPIPQDQGRYNNCVGWATAYAARTIMEAQKEGWTNQGFITANAFSPGFVYKLISPDASCYSPTAIDEALKVMAQTGTVKYSDLNDACPGQISSGLMKDAAQYKIKGYKRLFYLKDSPETKLESVRQNIAAGVPVVIGFRCPPSFEKADGQAVWNPGESPETRNYFGHAMCVIGYDNRKYGGAFEIQNSWGTRWGDNGYIWVRYDDFAAFAKYAYIIETYTTRVPAAANPPQTTATPGTHARAVNPEPSGAAMYGKLTFNESGGEEMDIRLYGNHYRFRKSYPGGTPYKLNIEGSQGFVYVFDFDPNRQVRQIFPGLRDQSAQIGVRGKTIYLPSNGEKLQVNQSLGEEYLAILFSKKPLNSFQLAEQLQQAPGSIFQRVEQVLGEQKLSAREISYQSATASFSGVKSDKSVAVLIVQLKRK
ncbi:MAG: C1 family peptidase [Bacteroidia bacterium]